MKTSELVKNAKFAKELQGPDLEKTMQERPPIKQDPDQEYEIVRGVSDDVDSSVTPLKHVNMLKRQFTRENLKEAILYIRSDGAQGRGWCRAGGRGDSVKWPWAVGHRSSCAA